MRSTCAVQCACDLLRQYLCCSSPCVLVSPLAPLWFLLRVCRILLTLPLAPTCHSYGASPLCTCGTGTPLCGVHSCCFCTLLILARLCVAPALSLGLVLARFAARVRVAAGAGAVSVEPSSLLTARTRARAFGALSVADVDLVVTLLLWWFPSPRRCWSGCRFRLVFRFLHLLAEMLYRIWCEMCVQH